MIALSVCYIAFSNIDGFRKYLNVKPPNMMLMITALGLIHGFGLSTRLQELPLSEDSLLLNIISFNVGIELGQISALVLMLLLIATWRKTPSFQTFSTITNYLLIILGGLLFLMQMHGYEHTTNPEEFAVSAEPTQGTENQAVFTDTGKVEDAQQIEWEDSITIIIPARSDKEYKLLLVEGATFEYAWQADGEPLFFDFHGEPTGDTTGSFQSFKKSTESQSSGALTAVFDGTHGWYWKNSTRSPVTVTLKVKGDYQLLDSKMVSQDTKPAKKTDTRTRDFID
ncbi:MAG: HupE/UreJ family protein [Candidatus Polarisedimenticolaceae bacterium]|nr:HupE/UreJ family protein [Candidatus Polarisedimenticolaceae bacterium]